MKDYTVIIETTDNGLFINGNLCEIETGEPITIIRNYSVGCLHSAYPNISKYGSIKGMKKLGYWDKTDKIVRIAGFQYNLSKTAISDALDALCLYLENNHIQLPAMGESKTFTFSI